jgi:NAD dependent epimerase/dehydratase family enzyme
LFRFGLGGRLGRGRQWLSWITLEDEVRAIVHVLGTPLAGAVNLTAPTPVTNAEFTRVLAAALHRPAVAAVPRFALGLALGSQMADEMILASQRALPAALEGSGFEFTDREVAGALARIVS